MSLMSSAQASYHVSKLNQSRHLVGVLKSATMTVNVVVICPVLHMGWLVYAARSHREKDLSQCSWRAYTVCCPEYQLVRDLQ